MIGLAGNRVETRSAGIGLIWSAVRNPDLSGETLWISTDPSAHYKSKARRRFALPGALQTTHLSNGHLLLNSSIVPL